MAGELIVRFVLGGLIVSLFAALGQLFEPKTFGGLFGAAPSVAIASLALAFAKGGSEYVATEARAMIFGVLGFFAYGAACVLLTQRRHMPVWLGASLAWSAWFAVTFGLWLVLRHGGSP